MLQILVTPVLSSQARSCNTLKREVMCDFLKDINIETNQAKCFICLKLQIKKKPNIGK